ncbi:hypothetical protein [Solirubrobacter soli]|uniref:hypothetical protein n=1 Tax=Solirubrobacter soli TaxID=363832 RepID=UPI00040AB26D|nr:hypothetical protein [Solirubrobacter soli]
MRKGPLIVFVAVLVIAALPVIGYLTKPREVIASTPAAYTGAQMPVPLQSGWKACVDQILFADNGRVARFGAIAGDGGAPPLEITVTGDGKSGYRTSAKVAGGWTATRAIDVPLKPPPTDTMGTFCVRNAGSQTVALVGNENGRAAARPTLKVNDQVFAGELPLRILESGQHSIVSRLGEVTTHASTLKPFGAWWLWVLAIALVTFVPVALWRAIGSALVADDAQLGAARSGPEYAWDSERWRTRFAAIPGWAWLIAIGTVVTLWLAHWSLGTHVFQNDENQYVFLARWVQDGFPGRLFDFALFGRGLQRLEVWLLAIPTALFDSPTSLNAGRVLNTIAYVSTAIPVYLIGRAQGLSKPWALLPATVAILVPWAVVTTGFLTENVAYPACMWALWSIVEAAAKPSPLRDVRALALLVVAAAARSGLILLLPVLPVVLAATGLRTGTGPLSARVKQVLRDHIVVWAVIVFGLLLLVSGVGGLKTRLAGGYQTQLGFDLVEELEKFGGYLSRVVIGTGFFPAVIGLPWVAVQIVRSRDPRRFAFALLVPVASLALLYSLNTAGPDERYVIYFAPLVLLPATLALARREVSALGVAIASVLLALLVLRVSWNPDQGPFGFFVSPVEMFYTNAIGLNVRSVIGDHGIAPLTLVGLSLLVAGLALAAAIRWAPTRIAGAPVAVLVAIVAFSVPLQAQYALGKYVDGAGSRSGPSTRERAFVDTNVPAGATVGEFFEGAGNAPGFGPLWQEVQFYNQRIDRVYALGPPGNAVLPNIKMVGEVGFDERTGKITSNVPLPDYLVIPTPVGTARVRGDIVAAPPYIAIALIKVAKPATMAWSAKGIDANGAFTEGDGATVRFYGTGLRPGAQCAAISLIGPTTGPATWNVKVKGSKPVTGSVSADQTRGFFVGLPRLAERGAIDVRISGAGIRVAGIGVGPRC